MNQSNMHIPQFRIGQGYDIHALVSDRKLILGGVHIPYEKGLLGHSDADALLHALTDALLGAAGLNDIGQLFPDDDPQFKDMDSRILLRAALQKVQAEAQAKAQLAQAQMQFDIQRMQAEAQIKEQLMQREFEYNMQLKGMEVDKIKQLDMDKEKAKDDRTKLQATQQSKLIEQRQKDLPAMNFESEEDSLDGFDLEQFNPR